MEKNDTCFNVIVEDLNSKIETAMNIEYHYDLKTIFSCIDKLDKSKKDEVYESLINHYLKGISNNNAKNIIESRNSEIDDIVDFFNYYHFIKNNMQSNDNYEEVYAIDDEADDIADELVSKLYIESERKLILPVKLEYLKCFCIRSNINDEQIYELLSKVVARLSVIYSFSLQAK